MLALKAKCFDDGLYAAIDILAHKGCNQFRGKRRFLHKIVEAVLRNDEFDRSLGLVLLIAASFIADAEVECADELRSLANEVVREHLASVESKPIGFYTWSPLLESHQSQCVTLFLTDVELDAGGLGRTHLRRKCAGKHKWPKHQHRNEVFQTGSYRIF